jgi:outer membrane protein TolC
MKIRYFSLVPLLLSMGLAWAADVDIAIPQVLSESTAQRWLSNDPALASADSVLAAAKIEAGQLALSPYDWVANGTYQRRDTGAGSNSNEWNVGLERTFRLPNKVRADEASAKAARLMAPAQYQHARREAAEALLNAWFDWLAADARKALLLSQQASVEDNVAVVGKRVKSGDASVLEHRLASAELTAIQRQVSEAKNAEAIAWALLAARYQATDDVKTTTLPEPIAVPQDLSWWQTRMLAVNDQLTLAQAQVASAEALAQRAKAEQRPDPTFGVFTGREAYGSEKLIGVTASIPLSIKRRSLEAERQQAQVSVARQNLMLAEREQRAAIHADYTAATGYFERWQLAQQAAVTLFENAKLTQKAYQLGEGDVQLLLLARRQALMAAEDAANAKVAALRSYYRLVLKAKLLWPDWLNGTIE